jgi:hypothetical protein
MTTAVNEQAPHTAQDVHRDHTNIQWLRTEAQRLWLQEPAAHPQIRESLLNELTEIDLRLERLSLRTSCDQPGEPDPSAIDECAERIRSLQRRWGRGTARQ